jgi:hypothetical protein
VSTKNPDAAQNVTVGHETPSSIDWSRDALWPEGNGAACALQVLPERVAISPWIFPDVSSYWPTATHEVAEAHDTDMRNASGKFGPASVAGGGVVGSGPSVDDHMPFDSVSITGSEWPAVSRY